MTRNTGVYSSYITKVKFPKETKQFAIITYFRLLNYELLFIKFNNNLDRQVFYDKNEELSFGFDNSSFKIYCLCSS